MVRRCKQVADLGAGPHNIVRFNAWGRFLALAGFGNLPGDLVFYERKADGKWKQLAATRCFLGYGFFTKLWLLATWWSTSARPTASGSCWSPPGCGLEWWHPIKTMTRHVLLGRVQGRR